MPTCRDCGNTTEFITAYLEFEVVVFQGDKCIDNYGGDRERLDLEYPPSCKPCGSEDIEGGV